MSAGLLGEALTWLAQHPGSVAREIALGIGKPDDRLVFHVLDEAAPRGLCQRQRIGSGAWRWSVPPPVGMVPTVVGLARLASEIVTAYGNLTADLAARQAGRRTVTKDGLRAQRDRLCGLIGGHMMACEGWADHCDVTAAIVSYAKLQFDIELWDLHHQIKEA